ncbi:MAG TPA: RNA polymerase sigma factor [Chitinophagales bacterium]|nr:RNA polymerase sigma factor [Chitinophagales bacterium]
MNENELIALLKQGNELAFKNLVEGFRIRVYNTCLGIVQSAPDAEDISQEVFVEVFRSVQHFKAEAKLSTWIYRIAVTKSLDHLRSKKRKKRFAFMKNLYKDNSNELRFEKGDFVHPGVEMENKELASYLFKAIEQLPENQKAAFTLNKIEGLSYQEVSEVMKMTLSSVESLMFRAKQNLQKILSDYYDEMQGA